MFESQTINRNIEKIQALPWRRIFAIVIISFLAASIMSSIIGWWLIGHAKRVAASVQKPPESISIGPPPGLSKEVVESILARNLFNSEGLTGDVADKAAGGEISKSLLPLRVVGIIYGGTPFTGIVMIENIQNKNVNSFMVGDQILADAVLEEIQRDLILIRTLGHLEFLALDEIELRRSSRTGAVKQKGVWRCRGVSGRRRPLLTILRKRDSRERAKMSRCPQNTKIRFWGPASQLCCKMRRPVRILWMAS